MKWTSQEIEGLERFYRGNLINSITGFKSLNLLGSISKEGKTNLAVFTQVLHLGANPALIGVLFRPQVPGMHSLQNIRETGLLTLNHVLLGEEEKAHWTSARWEESEFEAVGFEPEFQEGHEAPFVKGARIRMGLSAEQEIPLKINGTNLLIARLQMLEVPDDCLQADGFADLIRAGSMAGLGLDGYAIGAGLRRFSYARPSEKPEPI
jgi:flavin reductase (DIM6/NTAB) family NADH-FMN oxidoreductase RutF